MNSSTIMYAVLITAIIVGVGVGLGVFFLTKPIVLQSATLLHMKR